MANLLCINKYLLIIIILIIILSTVLLFLTIRYTFEHYTDPARTRGACPASENIRQISDQTVDSVPADVPSGPFVPEIPEVSVYPDVVRQYDYRKMFDPLEQPVRRVPRHELPPVQLKRMIDIPTRGYPDNFTQIGVLVKLGDPNKNDQNQILRLYGRQQYPGSNQYEYYTQVNSGLDQIKIPVRNKRRFELYDGDEVFIRELKSSYRVELHNFDEPRYYPDIVF